MLLWWNKLAQLILMPSLSLLALGLFKSVYVKAEQIMADTG